jgi:hypothetical protein
MMWKPVIISGGLGLAASIAYLGGAPVVTPAIDSVLEGTGLSSPDKLGWLDDKPLTDADRVRIAEIAGNSFNDGGYRIGPPPGHMAVIQNIMAGHASDISRRDIELLRQDRRRAEAAYPDVDRDKLLRGVWLQISLDARIPDDWNTSGNGDGTMVDGKWYLDGGMYTAVVRPEYPDRAPAEATKAYFAERKAKETALKLARTEYSLSWGGTDGSLLIDCKDGMCKVEQADEWATQGKRYTFPFVAAEWIDDPGGMDEIKKLPSFAQAKVEDIVVHPTGVMNGPPITDGDPNNVPFHQGMTLMPGQSTTVQVPIR